MRFDGSKMKTARKRKGLSLSKLQAEMARLNCDVSLQTLTVWERGDVRNPGYIHVAKMAQVLGEGPESFFSVEPNRTGTVPSQGRARA